MACKIFYWNREVGAWRLLKDCGRAEASPKHWKEQGDLETHLLLLLPIALQRYSVCASGGILHLLIVVLGQSYKESSSFAPKFEVGLSRFKAHPK